MLAGDDDFGVWLHGLAIKESWPRRITRHVEPNSGIASFRTARMVTRSSLAMACFKRGKPFAQRLHRRLVGLGRHDAGDADLDGRLLAGEQDFVAAARPAACR